MKGFMVVLGGGAVVCSVSQIIHFSKVQKLQCKISKFSSYFSPSKFASIICR